MLKRDLIKYVRDRAKSGYNKDSKCFICGSTTDLEFHHYHSMTEMLNKWLAKNGLKMEDASDIMGCRDAFIDEHYAQIYEETVTLCAIHHARLHKIYGIKPLLVTAEKQKRWVQRQKEKF